MRYRAMLLGLILVLLLPAGAAAESPDTGETGTADACVVVFTSPGCPHCADLMDDLRPMEETGTLRVEQYQIGERPELYRQYANSYGIPISRQGSIPAAFMGDAYCVGSTTCTRMVEEQIALGQAGACPDPSEDHSVSAVTLGGIAGLAATDAVNPCALAVLIILITSIMTRYPDRRRKALLAGISFTAAVFLAYFGMGVLLIGGLRRLAGAGGLSPLFYRGLGLAAIVLGLVNLKDWLRYGAGGFVMEVPFSWRPRMKAIINSATSPRGAFLVGLVVSLFLLPCTSGPYFVAGGLLAGMSWGAALPLLLTYNVIFVLPMVAITLAIYGGFTSVETVSDWRETNIRRLHLVAGLVLIALGIAMVLGLV